MNKHAAQRWGGAGLLLVGAAILFGSLLLGSGDLLVLAAAVLVLVVGAVLVGWSRRGPPV